jgi:hypothetical protein
MAAADRSWVTTPIPVRPPDTTLAAGPSVVKEGYVYCFVYCCRSALALDILKWRSAALRDLPGTWRAAADGLEQQMIASAAFRRIDVLGLREATAHLTDDAVRHGVAAALPAEVRISVRGRGKWASASLTQQSLRFVMINRTPRDLLPATARSA